jgi:acyl transferase domain-containing protein
MLTPELSIAAINSPVLCVVSGPFETIAQFQSRCESVNIPCRPLHTSHAFHSSMVEPVLPDFKAHVDSIKLEKPKVPIMSTVTGVWLSENDAKDPMYWTRHMRVTVRFSAAVKRLMEEISDGIFLEAGPRSTSTTLIRQHFHDKTTHAVVASLSDNGEPESDLLALAKATGLLWMYGVTLDWNSYYSNEKRIRIPLPTYQFDRQRYWVDNVASSRPVFYDLQVDTIKKEPEPADSKEPVPDVKMATADEYSVNIRKLIATALGCSPESIDETSSFLHLGMDSLLMRQFSQQIKLIFNREITIRQLMREYATIQTLSSFIRSSGLNG